MVVLTSLWARCSCMVRIRLHASVLSDLSIRSSGGFSAESATAIWVPCCLKDILSQGHWEGLRLRILRPNPSGEFFWLPQSVFRFAVTDYMCLIQDAFPGILFLNCDSEFAFLFWTGILFFSKKRLLEKDSLKWLFFEDSYWQAGALYVLCVFYFIFFLRNWFQRINYSIISIF